MAVRLQLLDKSAYVRGVEPTEDVELCLCAVTELEILASARSSDDYVALEEELASFRTLRMDAETFDVARAAQRELATTGHHRLPVPDVLLAACAHQYGADVVHVDRHFDALAAVLAFTSVRAG